MKRKTFWLSLLTNAVFILLPQKTDAQCVLTVESSSDYEVNIILDITGIDAPATCPWGYNFNIELDYHITITGSDAPGSLYTLQGEIVCDDYPSNFFNLPNGGGSGSVVTGSNPYNPESNCATVTPEELGCDVARIQINGPGIPNQTVECTFGSPLPVTLLSFKATPENNWVNIDWITASEQNNDFFSVEHSTDGINWTKIKEVKGAGTTSKEQRYKMTHNEPAYGINYYRLKQTDFDGKFEYSPIRSVEFNSDNGELLIFPNPAKDYITLTSDNSIGEFQIFNTIGEVVLDNSSSFSSERIDIADLPAGFYLIQAGNSTQKFIKN